MKTQPPKGEQGTATVLLVDDEEDFVRLVAQRLINRGLKVSTALSGEQALEAIGSREFDIIVIDLAMPGMDGIETLRRIKSLTPQTEIIMLTGHASLKSGIEAMKSGAEDYLEKPLDMNILLKKINDAQYRKMAKREESSNEELKKILKSKGW